MQIVSNDQTIRSETVQVIKDFHSQSTPAKKREQLVSMMPAIKKASDKSGDDIVQLSTENDALKNKIGPYDQQWLEESEAKLLKQIDNEKKANLIMSRKIKQMGKH